MTLQEWCDKNNAVQEIHPRDPDSRKINKYRRSISRAALNELLNLSDYFVASESQIHVRLILREPRG